MRFLSLLALSLVLSTSVAAEDQAPSDVAPVPEPPPIPESVESGEPIEPDVTIIQREKETIEEYRVNGQLYMVKITPTRGKPYYLVDMDGDGNLETRRSELEPNLLVPQWVIFRF